MDIYGDKKINNAVNKLMNKYGWYTNIYMSWDWGHVFWKRYYDEKKRYSLQYIRMRNYS